jgi:UDP-glucose 4-epimerase
MITGGLGVIGSRVARKLLERGHSVCIADTRADFTLAADLKDDIKLVIADVRDIDTLTDAVRDSRIQRVIHTAATMPPIAQENPRLGFEVNGLGSINVLEAARSGCAERVVFASSKLTYSRFPHPYGHPTYAAVDESVPTAPVTNYGVCKAAVERLGINYHRDFGLEFAALRFATIYGPGKLLSPGAAAVHGTIVEGAASGSPVRLPGGGDQRDDVIYVDDVAEAITLAALADAIPSEIYHIGSGELRTLSEFADAVRSLIPGARIHVGPGLDYFGDDRYPYSLFSIERASRELGYHPRFGFRDGIGDYLAAVDRFGLLGAGGRA